MWMGADAAPNASMKINGKDIEFVTKMKALGITITFNLSWEDHANNVITKGERIPMYQLILMQGEKP